jgi:hypothetical protein
LSQNINVSSRDELRAECCVFLNSPSIELVGNIWCVVVHANVPLSRLLCRSSGCSVGKAAGYAHDDTEIKVLI